jgi:hypothetical protein
VPVFFHNGRGYDFHHLMPALQKVCKVKEEDFQLIAENFEKYKTITWYVSNGLKIVFKNSFMFLTSSIEKLVDLQKMGYDEGNNRVQFMNLIRKFPNTFKCLQSAFPKVTFAMMKLMTQKGVYPYSFVDSEEKYALTEFPPIEAFYDDLNKVECSLEDYQHAQNVWNVFGCKSFKDYHDLYLMSDVNLLTDVFETFRKMGMDYYGLDPSWYITLPQYANDCLYKYTGHMQELFTDIDMHLWIEQSIRGGISVISHRHAKANNKYMKDFNPNEPLH